MITQPLIFCRAKNNPYSEYIGTKVKGGLNYVRFIFTRIYGNYRSRSCSKRVRNKDIRPYKQMVRGVNNSSPFLPKESEE